MRAVFLSPHLIDAILGLTGVEAGILMYWHRKTGRGPAASDVVSLLLPGFCLMLALRAALANAVWPWVPAALAGALVCHLADLRKRFNA